MRRVLGMLGRAGAPPYGWRTSRQSRVGHLDAGAVQRVEAPEHCGAPGIQMAQSDDDLPGSDGDADVFPSDLSQDRRIGHRNRHQFVGHAQRDARGGASTSASTATPALVAGFRQERAITASLDTTVRTPNDHAADQRCGGSPSSASERSFGPPHRNRRGCRQAELSEYARAAGSRRARRNPGATRVNAR